MLENTKKVLNFLTDLKNHQLQDKDIQKILKIQALEQEVSNNGN